MTQEMTPADAASAIDWEAWAECAALAGYELSQPGPAADGSWPVVVSAEEPRDRFLLVRAGLPAALISVPADGRMTVRPGRSIMFTR